MKSPGLEQRETWATRQTFPAAMRGRNVDPNFSLGAPTIRSTTPL